MDGLFRLVDCGIVLPSNTVYLRLLIFCRSLVQLDASRISCTLEITLGLGLGLV